MVISVTAHAIALALVLAASLFAPDLLPAPRALLAWSPERVVQPVDISLPTPDRSRSHDSPTRSTGSAPTQTTPAPVEASAGIAPETNRESISPERFGNLATFERGGVAIAGFGITENAPALPPARPEPVRPHAGVQAPRKTFEVAPKYPSLARESHTEGIVILEVIIDERGNVTSTRVLKSVSLLDQAAIDAVQQWKFTPTRLNGEPIPIVMTVTVSFKLQ